ncbi:alpha/beta fold hydrolase [Arthrobacter castelli]|uniref:alpha/beta fold hydrolase n=1 Tax=Arthrobacter castelli TaxID=271431 RepID=UPI001B7FC368|nr:alpha/beta hydrolase [Arthrobacter castelli]
MTDNLIADGLRIAYRDRGRGEPVIFIHGTPSHSYEWRNIVPSVEAAGYRVITYDLPGFGLSERPVDQDTSVAAQTGILKAILDQLAIETVSIISHDIGGAIGLRFATAHPERVRRLMVIDTVSYDSWPSSTWRKIIEEELDDYTNLSQEAFNALLTRQLKMTVKDEATMAGDILHGYLAPNQSALGRASFFEHQMRHYDSKYTEDISGKLGALTMPVRILWDEGDRWEPLHYAERLAGDIPGTGLIVVPEAGHFVMEDAPKQVTGEIADFLTVL